ncbi:MAG: molybdopterin-guanine dinucleotide biosynthesis protein B [Peptococcaceae bacterium]|nr:molybdopterin-guanine dinucleotide biosynthesis protein B [Peptococcaceae bacterium]
MRDIPVVSVVGESGAGKTTFLEKLVRELKVRNIRVGVIKHHVHDIDIDRPGKDTWRLSRAGADAVAISTPGGVGLFLNLDREMDLDELAGMFRDMDIVLTEGYKRGDKPKIEVNRSDHSDRLVSDPAELIAIVSDVRWEVGVPVFGLEDPGGVADFLESRYRIGRK